MMKKAAVFPNKYIQGNGVLKEIGDLIKPFGQKPMILWGKRTRAAVSEDVFASLKACGMDYVERMLPGECSKPEAARIEAEIKEKGCDIVIGMGGGKAMDIAKAAAQHVGLRCVIVPTAASSDAPTSACTVWYNEDDGSFEEFELWPVNPDIILVDTGVMVKAPLKLFMAGIGDALATYPEAKSCYESYTPACSGGYPTMTALAMAKLCFDTLVEYSEAAIMAVKTQLCTPAFEKVVEATTLLSGIGWESCGVATAHVLGNALANFPEAHAHMHGEKVAFGIVTQLCIDPGMSMTETYEIVDFMVKIGLPVTFADLDMQDVSKERLYQWAVEQTQPGSQCEHHTFPITAEDLYTAMLAADALGQERKALLAAK